MVRHAIFLAVALSGAVTAYSAPAEACINSIERFKERAAPVKRDDLIRSERANGGPVRPVPDRLVRVDGTSSDRTVLDEAIDDLNASRNRAVVQKMYSEYGLSLNQWALNPRSTTSLQHEVVQLVALATLRSDGLFYRDEVAVLAPPEVHSQNVKWAILALENLAFVNAIPDRHLAEAWARDPDLHEAALKKLFGLALRNKLESPHQFRALARLLREDGKEEQATVYDEKATALAKLDVE